MEGQENDPINNATEPDDDYTESDFASAKHQHAKPATTADKISVENLHMQKSSTEKVLNDPKSDMAQSERP